RSDWTRSARPLTNPSTPPVRWDVPSPSLARALHQVISGNRVSAAEPTKRRSLLGTNRRCIRLNHRCKDDHHVPWPQCRERSCTGVGEADSVFQLRQRPPPGGPAWTGGFTECNDDWYRAVKPPGHSRVTEFPSACG